ncbi:MAG TPA: sugar transferase [Terriglobales bacterium]|nr:sugar transferase [Terriglobales bacterium]
MFIEARPRRQSCLQVLPHRNSAKRTQRRRIGVSIKHCFDVVASLAALILLSPLFLLISIMVRLNDGGSIIYRRRVVGSKGGFDAYKFRSMRLDADAILATNSALREEFEKNFKLTADPRVTRIGAWLRKFSLDELPQLFNVLRGEMSLVGPRMISPPELEKYGDFKVLLLSVKPGLTGYWQVYGRQRVDYAERVRMDVFYIQNWSLALDLKLLLLTPIRVLKGTGAY